MRRADRARLLAAAVAAAAPLPALAQGQPAPAPAGQAPNGPGNEAGAVAALIDQANYWRMQNRPELVLRTLERVLAVDPRNVEALSGAAQAQAQLGNRAGAESYLARLRQVAPNDPRLAETDISVRAATVDQGALAEARRLAQAGRGAEAAARYRDLFRGATPPDAYALEYYQTLAGTEGGYAEAREGMGRLASRTPNDMRVQLAYAQVLTYRDATRSEGIGRLRRLAQNPEVTTAAVAAWRQALLWQGPNPSLVPEFEAFLRQFPNDTVVAAKLEEARNPPSGPPDESGMARIRGFEQLNASRLRDAQREFEAALATNPNDADALGGLGLVRLREGRFGEARQLLERAIAAAPDRRSQWQRALDGAAYAQELASARSLLQRGDLNAAEATLRRAVQRETADRADADALLGDLAMRRGDLAGAEQRYRAALARRPNLGAAASGLYEVLQQQGRFAEAEELQRRLGRVMASGDSAAQRANALRSAAAGADPQSAIAQLQAALQTDPGNPWVRLDLARLLARQGRVGEARALVEEPVRAGGNAEALYAAALFAEEQERPADAAALVNRIPVRLRSTDMTRLLARTRVAGEVQAILQQYQYGRRAEARQMLIAMAARPDPTGASASLSIRALGQLNDSAGAAEAGRAALAVNRSLPPSARLAIAGALLAAGAEQEAVILARSLGNEATLTSDERRQAAAVEAGLAVRTSDRLNEAGDQAGAYDVLAPALARDPTNPAANLALARLYQGAERPREAQQIAEGVLARDPQSMEARYAAVDAAIAARDWQRAEALLVEARALTPNSTRVALLEARLARAWGNSGRALRALEVAQQRRQAELAASGAAVPQNQPAYENPFRRLSRPAQVGGPLALPSDPLSAEIARELASVREETATRFQAGLGFRSRSGTAGLDRLTEYSAPVDLSFSPNVGGRITVSATPLTINTGRMDTSNLETLRAYGYNALNGALRTSASATQAVRERAVARDDSATGISLGMAYARDGFAVDVGSSPLGFRRSNVLGGIEVAPALNSRLRLRLIAEQRSVTDSLLSWSGARDPVTGRTWGGVVRTGGRAQLEYVDGPLALYAGGGYYTLTGSNVERNNRVEAGAGAAYTIFRTPEDELIAGLDLVYFRYDKNQRLFSFGNGGYFSPQSYFAANVPIDYRARTGNLAYRIDGTIGYQNYRESSAPFFPRDPAAQGALDAAAASDPNIRSRQPSRSESGIVGGVRGDVEYAVTPNLRIGALLRYDRSANWNEARGLLYARYRFDR